MIRATVWYLLTTKKPLKNRRTNCKSWLTGKIKKHLTALGKQQQFETRKYFQLYPSDLTLSRLFGVIEANKPGKSCTMRTIVSTVSIQPCGLSQHLVELIQSTLNKSRYKVPNSASFVNEAKNWLVKQDEIQTSYDIINIYSSVPINKTLNDLVDQRSNHNDDLMKSTKLCLKDIYVLAELYPSKCPFLWRVSNNSGPIGPSFMVVLSERYVQNLEQKAIEETLISNLAINF